MEHVQLGNEVLSPLSPPIAWKVPCPGAVAMLMSALSKTLHKSSTEFSKGEEFLHLCIYQFHHLIALSHHKTAEYVNQFPRPVLLAKASKGGEMYDFGRHASMMA